MLSLPNVAVRYFILLAHHSSNRSSHDVLHVIGTAREYDTYRPHLVLADLAGKSGSFQSMLDRLRAGMNAGGICYQLPIQVRAFFVGIRGFDLAFDVGRSSAVRSVCLLHMEYDIAHSHVVFRFVVVAGSAEGRSSFALLGNFQRCKAMRLGKFPNKLCLFVKRRGRKAAECGRRDRCRVRQSVRIVRKPAALCVRRDPPKFHRAHRSGKVESLRTDFSFHRARLYLAE